MPVVRTASRHYRRRGLGALYAALKLAPRPVLMISPEALGRGASSAWAQGGVAAAMDPGRFGRRPCPRHPGAPGPAPSMPRWPNWSPRRRASTSLDLTRLGTPSTASPMAAMSCRARRRMAFARVVRVRGDQAGAEIMRALIAEVRETPSVQVLEGVIATGLRLDGGRVAGVEVTRADGSQPVLSRAGGAAGRGGSGGFFYA